MLESGLYEELAEYFTDPGSISVSRSGLKMAIGVPEFSKYFEKNVEYEEAVRQMKENTCQLAKKQLWKILRLRDEAGWELQRMDATAAVMAALGGKKVGDIWEKEVLEPSVKIVKQFLME
ncbi:hypothetical protein RD792_005944 [Penstemon davidsonii]|uniref:Uncharacterized protein n=1 Tax=Penstemon davidsonii TaxID=160366 RepID=A0ABR0DEY6_9LAMI|nr:hypothetical protein RD792_005944 [Penstemon davidsonii]